MLIFINIIRGVPGYFRGGRGHVFGITLSGPAGKHAQFEHNLVDFLNLVNFYYFNIFFNNIHFSICVIVGTPIITVDY